MAVPRPTVICSPAIKGRARWTPMKNFVLHIDRRRHISVPLSHVPGGVPGKPATQMPVYMWRIT